jgi:hypothetical protein
VDLLLDRKKIRMAGRSLAGYEFIMFPATTCNAYLVLNSANVTAVASEDAEYSYGEWLSTYISILLHFYFLNLPRAMPTRHMPPVPPGHCSRRKNGILP